MGEVVLQTVDLTRKFRHRTVVDRLSLTVEKGDVFGFLGRNGAGKSTTLRIVLGLVRPTFGSVTVLGHEMSRHPLRALKRIGAIIEAPAFYENFSGRQNLRMLAAMSGGVEPEHIESVLELVNLRERARDPVRVYSHGMRQRLGIAQALLPDPELIILDEPTDGLDPQGLFEIRELICRLRDELHLTIVLSSHLLHEVEQICNRLAIIDGGRLIYQGATNELVQSRNLVKFKVDRTTEACELLARGTELPVTRNGDQSFYLAIPDKEIPPIVSLLVQAGFQITEVSPQRQSLEQVFLRLTDSGQVRN